MDSVYAFIFRKLAKVKGYIDPSDSLVFVSIFEKQKKEKFSGGVVEIGVYYGRSFLLLKKLAEQKEVLGIDLFIIDPLESRKTAQYREFIENGKKLDMPINDEFIIAGDSTQVSCDDVVGKVGEVRFFSVDGGHMLSHVESDSRLAKESLADCGVIAFDDSFNPEWPEVTVGIIDFIRANADEYSVFCITNKKTYVCKRKYLSTYRDAVQNSPYLKAFQVCDVEILGTKAIRVHHPIKRRIMYEVLVRAGMAGLSERVYRS